MAIFAIDKRYLEEWPSGLWHRPAKTADVKVSLVRIQLLPHNYGVVAPTGRASD